MSRNDFLPGTDTAALYALIALNRPSTGAQVHDEIQGKSSIKFTLSSVYKCLDRMHKRDFVLFEERTKTFRDLSTRTVRFYQITDAGRDALMAARRLHDEMGPQTPTVGERVAHAALRLVLPLAFTR